MHSNTGCSRVFLSFRWYFSFFHNTTIIVINLLQYCHLVSENRRIDDCNLHRVRRLELGLIIKFDISAAQTDN